MKCPSPKELVATFRDLGIDTARLIRNLTSYVDDNATLKEIVEESCPATATYVRSLYNDPYGSAMWRRTVVLHAIDKLLGTCGVEAVGPCDMHDGPPIEYCNAGDPYVVTLLYYRDRDELVIGCWGDAAEEQERESVPEAWNEHGRDDFRAQLSSLLDSIDPEHDHDCCEASVDAIWRDGCQDMWIDEFIQESSGYYFPTDLWCRTARASTDFCRALLPLAIACRVTV